MRMRKGGSWFSSLRALGPESRYDLPDVAACVLLRLEGAHVDTCLLLFGKLLLNPTQFLNVIPEQNSHVSPWVVSVSRRCAHGNRRRADRNRCTQVEGRGGDGGASLHREIKAVLPCLRQREQAGIVDEQFCLVLARSEIPQRRIFNEQIRHGRRYRRVLVLRLDQRTLIDPWRDENGRHANPKPVKLESADRVSDSVRRDLWRTHVVVCPAVFVIDDQQQRVFPNRTLADAVVDIGNEIFSGNHVVVWMLIRG